MPRSPDIERGGERQPERQHNLTGECWCDWKYWAICQDCEGLGLGCWCQNGWNRVGLYSEADLIVHQDGDVIFHHAPTPTPPLPGESEEGVA